MTNLHRDRLFSYLVIVMASIAGYNAFGYSIESSYFPRILALGLIGLALILLVRSHLPGTEAVDDETELRDIPRLITALSIFIGLVIYSLGIGILNFEISTPLFLIGFMWLAGYRNLNWILSISFVVTALLYFIFFNFLAVSRPESMFFG